MSKKFLCLSGDYGVGKTTTAKTLESLSTELKAISLGNMVRDEIADKLEFIPKKDLYAKPTPPYIRNLIKGYGETKKHYHDSGDSVWMLELIKQTDNKGDNFIIDDLRFHYDYEYLVKVYGKESVYLVFIGDLPDYSDYDLPYFYAQADRHIDKFNDQQIYELLEVFNA